MILLCDSIHQTNSCHLDWYPAHMDRLHVKRAPGPARAHRVQRGGQAGPRRVQAVLQGEACVRILFLHWLLFELTLKSRRDLKSGRRQSTWYKDGEALTIRVCHRKAGDPLLCLSPNTCPVHYIHSKSAMEQVCSSACLVLGRTADSESPLVRARSDH